MVFIVLSMVVLLNQFQFQVVNGRKLDDGFEKTSSIEKENGNQNGNYLDQFGAPIQEKEYLEEENFEDLDGLSSTFAPAQVTTVPNQQEQAVVVEGKYQEEENSDIESNFQQNYVQKFVSENVQNVSNVDPQSDECLNACINKCGSEKAVQYYNCPNNNSTEEPFETCNCVPGSQIDFMSKQVFESDCPQIFCKSHQATCCDIYSKDPKATCSALSTTYSYGGECDADGDGKKTNVVVEIKMAFLVIACYCPF